jgi:hydroxypyruvate isomerase
MPRFAANLTFLFNEVPFLERFGEAAQAGFRAVEFASPYEYRISEVVAQQREHRLEIVLINAPSGDWAAGDRGLASLPGREHEFTAGIANALQYAKAFACRAFTRRRASCRRAPTLPSASAACARTFATCASRATRRRPRA